MELFSKFDICWGYNNIHIWEGDQWKAAFKTCQGLFKPKVMFFGVKASTGLDSTTCTKRELVAST